MPSQHPSSSAGGPVAGTLLHLGGYTADQSSPCGLGRVRLLEEDGGSVAFETPEQLEGPGAPSWVLTRPGHEGQLLAVAEGEPGGVVLTDGRGVIARAESGGDGPCHLALSPEGRWLLVSNYVSGSVGLVEVDGDRLTLVDSLRLTGEGPHERQDAPHAHQATFRTDDLALVCDLGSDRVVHVRVVDDRLQGAGEIVLPAGTGPRHLAAHPGRDDVL